MKTHIQNILFLALLALYSCETSGDKGGSNNPSERDSSIFSTKLTPDEITGTWNITMSCIQSDCKNHSVGNIITENWNINYINGTIKVIVTGNTSTADEYAGRLENGKLFLQYKRSDHKSDVVLELKSSSKLSGTREVVNTGYYSPCTIKYTIAATR